MNVGILSMQRVTNWGSFLQAFALKKTVESFGHKCGFIDIKECVGLTAEEIESIRTNSRDAFGSRIRRGFRSLLDGHAWAHYRDRLHQRANQPYRQWLINRFDAQFIPLLGIDPSRHEHDDRFDLAIIGSDEVFNCAQNAGYCRTMHLFGQDVQAARVVTYAASFGNTDLNTLKHYHLTQRIKTALGHIARFSVRDTHSQFMIRELTGRDAEISIDPVLLVEFEPFFERLAVPEEYMVVYSYPGRRHEPSVVKALVGYARKRGLKIVSLFGRYDWADESIMLENPFELLAYFKQADRVFTDTFHGALLAIKYNRPFCALVHEENSNKMNDLMGQNRISGRIAQRASDIVRILESPADFGETNGIIAREKQKAAAYLRNVLTE